MLINKLSLQLMFWEIHCLVVMAAVCTAQFSPTWGTSQYIEAKTFSVVNGVQKTSGNFTNTITFSGVFPTPAISLSIPQLRIVSSSQSMNFKCYYSSLTSTSFVNTLQIPTANTVIWYLQERYFVVSMQLLPNCLQTGLLNVYTTIINASGSIRTQSFSNASLINFSFNTSQNPTCAPFLNGDSSTSIDYYQLNLTCSISASSTFMIQATTHPNTLVTSLMVSIVAYNPTDLAVQSIYFVDYTITTTYQGTETLFVSLPYGYHDSNFIGGLCSFSTQDNMEFNVTLAIPSNNTVYNSASSLYDNVPQLQIRVRFCPTADPYYNIVDKLCYATCPSTTYLNSVSLLCSPCGSNCLTCLSNLSCTTCINSMVNLNGLCACSLSFYLYNNTCYGCHYSCQTCTTSQQFNCVNCTNNTHRLLVTVSSNNQTCCCISGFYDAGTAVCAEVCGDGKAIIDPCDDGNTKNGDGCSSSCKIEPNFNCSLDTNSFSTCFFTGNVSLTLLRTQKDPYSNSVSFYFQVTPWVDIMTLLADPSTLSSNRSFTNVQCSLYAGKEFSDHANLVYTGTYTSAIQDTYLRFDLKTASTGIFSKLPATNVTVQCSADNDFYLIVYSDKDYFIASVFRHICTVFCALILASAPLYIFGRLKWVGNMLFLSLQFQFLSTSILDRFTPMIEGFSYLKYVTGYNQIIGLRKFDDFKYNSFWILGYNIDFQRNVNFMVTFQVLGIVMYIIYYIFWRRNELTCKKYGGDPQKTFNSTRWGKFLSFFNWQFFMFWSLFNMTKQILSLILSSQKTTNYRVLPFQIFCMVCILLALLPLFIKRKTVPSYTQLLYYKQRGKEQQILTLGGFALLYLLYYVARTQLFAVYYVVMLVPIVLIIYLVCRRPFQSKWVRAAYFINNACILVTLIYNRIALSEQKSNVLYLPFGAFAIIVFDWVFNIIVWARQAYVICRYGGEEGLRQIFESKTKTTTEQEAQMNGYFKNGKENLMNESIMNNLMRTNSKMENFSKHTKRITETSGNQPQESQQQNSPGESKLDKRKLKTKKQPISQEMKEIKQLRRIKSQNQEIRSKHKGSILIQPKNQHPINTSNERSPRIRRQQPLSPLKTGK